MSNLTQGQLKAKCFIPQTTDEFYSCRLKAVGGYMEAKHVKAAAELADKYGKGYIHLTARQSVEIPFVHKSNIEAMEQDIIAAGLSLNKCGPGLRTITACQGDTTCKSGNIDTLSLANEIDERFSEQTLPHKFKIGITGCRNNCLKAEENDIGIKGAKTPIWKESECTYCGACQRVCPVAAIKVDRKEKSYILDNEACISCGRCIKSCHFDALDAEAGFHVFFGGLFGNRIAIGKTLLPVVRTKEELFVIIEVALNFFEQHANKKERFCTLLDRVGWDVFKKELEEAL